MMNLSEIHDALVQLKTEENMETLRLKLKTFSSQYEQALDQQLENEADENEENTDSKELIVKINELTHVLDTKVQKYLNEKSAAESQNLAKRKEILQQLGELSNANLGSLKNAFEQFQQLQNEWKDAGQVPKKHLEALRYEYRFLIEKFFYNIKIYKDLKEYDLKKNKELKEEIIGKLEQLVQQDDIKSMEEELHQLENEWDEIGPTFDQDWAEIRGKFKEGLDAVYAKIKAHRQDIFEKLMNNEALKRAQIDKLEKLLENKPEKAKDWSKQTEEIKKLIEEYRAIGFARKRENKKLFEQFNALCAKFFEEKQAFFGSMVQEYTDAKEQKSKLIDRMNKLKLTDKWGFDFKQVNNWMNEWKTIGHSGKDERKLWDEFKGLMDEFYAAKKEKVAEQENEQQENLNKKQQLIAQLQDFTSSGNAEADLEKISQFESDWQGIGFVPIKQKAKLESLYESVLQNIYDKLNLQPEQLEALKFEKLLSKFIDDPQANRKIQAMKKELNEKKAKVTDFIAQYERNLGFFSKSKSANDLLKEAEKRLGDAKKDLGAFEDKIKRLNQSLKQLQKSKQEENQPK